MCATPITAQSWPALSYSSVNLLHRQRMLRVRRRYLFVCLFPSPLVIIRQVLSIRFDIRSLAIFLLLVLLFPRARIYPPSVDLIPERRVSVNLCRRANFKLNF